MTRSALREHLVDVAGVDDLAEGEVVAEVGMDWRRAGIERGLLFGDGRQLFPVDEDFLGGVLGLGARSRHDHRHRLAGPAGAVDGHGILRRRFHAGKAGERADPGAGAEFREFGARHDEMDARRALRLRRIDGKNSGVGERAPHEGGVEHAREREVVGVAAAAGDGALGPVAGEGAADVAVGFAEQGVEGLVAHGRPPFARASSVVATASTMAW